MRHIGMKHGYKRRKNDNYRCQHQHIFNRGLAVGRFYFFRLNVFHTIKGLRPPG